MAFMAFPSGQSSFPASERTSRRAFAVSALAAEVLLGGGVLAAWIVAIYLGLAWFRHLAKSDARGETTTELPQTSPDRARGRRRRLVLRGARAH